MVISHCPSDPNVRRGPYNVMEAGAVVTTADYMGLVGEEHESTWFIQAPDTAVAVQLTVGALQLAGTKTEKVSETNVEL